MFVPCRWAPKASRKSSWSSSGTPSRSATTNSENGFAYAARNSHWPSAMNSSMWRSASRHMKSSFSFSRLGVSSRERMDRASVWCGGSIVTMCSNIGISVRCSSSCAQMSSPSGANGIGVNGPITATQDE